VVLLLHLDILLATLKIDTLATLTATLALTVCARLRIPAVTLARRLLQEYDLLNPQTYKILLPSPTELPFLDLKLYCSYQCTQCKYMLLKSKSGFGLMN
jgi:hypothetical protein